MLPQTLHLEHAVSQLPLRLRLLARAAAAGSSKDLQRLRDLAKAVPNSSQVTLFLPVFFTNLHPRLIPSPEQVDTLPWNDFILPISNAICSLDYLRILQPIPVDARLSIWHRVWVWMQFIHIYRSCIRRLETYSEPAIYEAFLTVANKLARDDGIAQELGDVPGFSVLLVHAWKIFILAPDDASSPYGLREVCTVLCSYAKTTGSRPHHLEEFLEGSGGSLSHLASLAVKHLDHHVTHPHMRFPLFILSSVVMFLATNLEDNTAFQDALISHGSMACFVRVALVLAEGRHGPGDDIMVAGDGYLHRMLSYALSYLTIHLIEPRACGYMREAVRAGLLQAIIASAIGCDATSNTQASLQTIVDLLKQYTVHHSVLSCLEPALRDVKSMQTTHGFTHSFLFLNWSAFWDLAHERIEMLKYYESADYVSLKACGALQCGVIHRKRDLMCCSSCKQQWYCSKRCQSADWKDGHRESCALIVSFSQNEPETLSTRDRSFLRALIDHDYKLAQPAILLWQLDFMNAYPGETPCLVFDYSQGRSTFKFAQTIDFPDKWSDDLARATRHSGHFQLHIAVLSVSDTDMMRLVPMQSSSGALVDSLTQLKEELDEGIGGSAPMHAQIQGRIAAAMSLARHVTQFH
ncbi:hypothetical protein DFH06DRAFT_558786 [Mycena polygramma]|nr:hypothetical protein DFH06DRAFT_558786 [Mycena polygramma]